MFLHPGAVGAVVGANYGLRRRQEERALNRVMNDELMLQLCERTPVLIMKVRVGTAGLQAKFRKKNLRLRLKLERRELLTTKTTKALDDADCARFDFNVGTEFVLQGDEVLSFEVLQPHPIFPSTTLGTCLMSMSEVREALGGGRLTQSAGQPVLQELLLCVPNKLPEEVLGSLQVVLQLDRSTLATAMLNESLNQTLPMSLVGAQSRVEDARLLQNRSSRHIPMDVAHVPMGTVVRESTQPSVRTADGGQMSTRSWVDSATDQLRHEAILVDAMGNIVERVEWTDTQPRRGVDV